MQKKTLCLILFLVFKLTFSQTTYRWNGSTSSNWNVNTNWTPNGVPTSTDNVVIVAATNTCVLPNNTSVNNFTVTSGVIDIGTYTLTVIGTTSLTAGTINGINGLLDFEGATTVIGTTSSGPIINPKTIINALTIRIQRSTFNSTINVTKLAAGISTDSWRGGNTFNGEFYLDNASAFPTADDGDIYLGSNINDPIDIFNSRATFYITGCARIRIPQNGSAIFNGVTSFYSNGYGTVHDRMQPARSGTASVTFNDSTYFYCNSATTDMQIAYDPGTKATFNGPIVATHYGPSAAAFLFGNDGTVLFNDNVTLNCLGTGAITITEATGTSTLAAGKTISVGNLGFSSGRLDINNFTQLGNTSQLLALTGTATLSIGAAGKPCVFNGNVDFSARQVSSIASSYSGTATFNATQVLSSSSALHLGNVNFNSAQSLTSRSSIYQGTANFIASQLTSTLSIHHGATNFSSGQLATVSTTYMSTCNLSKTGSSDDNSGDNIFNGAVIINHSASGEFRFSSVVGGDSFNETVEFNNTGSGSIRPARTFSTTFLQNITISNTTGGGIIFGANGGVSTLAGGKLILVGAGGYANGYLNLYRVNQSIATSQNINLSGAATVLTMGSQSNITSGCNFAGDFVASAKGIELTGNRFGGTTEFNQSGSTTTRAWGGNTFIGVHTLNVSGAAGIQCSQLVAAETYSSNINVNLTSSGGVTLARTYNTIFPESIVFTGTSTGGFAFGVGGGSSTLFNGKTLSIGSAGFAGNFLYLYKFNQIGTTPHSFSLTGTSAMIHIGSASTPTYGCNFDGDLNVSSPNFTITSSTFNGTTNFVKTGGSADDNNGNNTFNGSFSFANTCTTSAVFVRMSNIFGADTYNGVTTFSTSCPAGGFVLARSYDGYFNENVICNSAGGYIYFSAGNGLTGTSFLAANKTITCGTFTAGLLCFRRLNQLSNTPQNINTTGTGNIEYGGVTSNSGTFTNFEGSLNTSAGGYMAINASTFQRDAIFSARSYTNVVNSNFNTITGNTSISRIGGTSNDDLGGGNIFNGNLTFNNTGSGRYRSGVTAYGGDIFNGNVDINNSGTGTISFGYNNGTNTIAGNLNLSSSSTGSIIFGEAATINTTTLTGIFTAASGNYTNGTINLRYLQQNGGANSIVGTSNAVAFTINSSTVNGVLTTTNVGTTNLLRTTFQSNVSTENSGTTTFSISTFNNNAATINSGATTVGTSTFNAQTTTTNSGVTSISASIFNGNVTTVNTSTTTIRSSTLNAVNNFTSASFILGGTLAQGSVYNNGTSIFTKNGTTNDDVNGGNVFNTPVVFNSSNTSGRWYIGNTSADDFNDDVTLNQQNTGILTAAYNSNSTFAGNITVSAPTGNSITFSAGTSGRVTLDGGIAQTISKTSGDDPNFTRLTIDKTTNNVTLNTRINIVTNFTPTSGILNTTSANILNMNTGSSTSIGSSSSYVNGPMNYDMASNATTRRTLNFPIGKSAEWRPVVLQTSHSSTTSYTYKAELTNANANALGMSLPSGVSHVSYVHYWDIDRFNTSTGSSSPNTDLRVTTTAGPIVTLYYGANDGVTDVANLSICKNTYTATGAWIDIGATGATVSSGSVSSTSTAFNSFSKFTLANKTGGTNPLPVELLYFTATPVDNKTVSLDWATASEINNSYYDIERSIDGLNFEFLTTVKAYGNGNSVTKQIYNTTDNAPYKGISYYRLKQIDLSGEYSYADIVSVNINSKSFINFFPNPASDKLNFTASEDFENANITIINSVGAVVFNETTLNNINDSINLSQFANGMYYVVVKNAEESQTFKISIQK